MGKAIAEIGFTIDCNCQYQSVIAPEYYPQCWWIAVIIQTLIYCKLKHDLVIAFCYHSFAKKSISYYI